MIKGVGIDMVPLAQMQRQLPHEHFIRRVFTADERAMFDREPHRRLARMAGNFAVKEALSKALGTGLAGCPLGDVSVLRNESGAPYVQAAGRAAQKLSELGATKIWVSITNTQDMAIAQVILEGEE
ncbi:MAG: holo-ACP synthase [Eubacteriales bacterium]|nr:holo-ACP synthase [Eubacteriales bacterium]